ncbi:MAG: mercury methylation corrinoid protein HgcA [Pseudomonadota bacterium]
MVTTEMKANAQQVSTELAFRDKFGAFKARLGIGRMRYRVKPGLYELGNPTDQSPVFVSANYKMSFDKLRANLRNMSAWILVLDTHGINVWCAAGKGTFGTDEIVRQVTETKLHEIVSHKRLIVPQLGAPGVSAHEVQRKCGFKIIYGPILASDILTFMNGGMKALPRMRRIEFPIRKRATLIPLEILAWAKVALIVAACLLLLAGLGAGGFSPDRIVDLGIKSAAIFLAAYLAGGILTPILLPFLPGRAFALKGLWIGIICAAALLTYTYFHAGFLGAWPSVLAWAFLIPVVTSFMAMNFTGSSTFTSLSGVRREMRFAVPIQIVSAVIGLGLWVAGLFV